MMLLKTIIGLLISRHAPSSPIGLKQLISSLAAMVIFSVVSGILISLGVAGAFYGGYHLLLGTMEPLEAVVTLGGIFMVLALSFIAFSFYYARKFYLLAQTFFKDKSAPSSSIQTKIQGVTRSFMSGLLNPTPPASKASAKEESHFENKGGNVVSLR